MLRCDAKACRAALVIDGAEPAGKQADAAGWSYDADGRDWCPWHKDPERRVQEPQPEETPT